MTKIYLIEQGVNNEYDTFDSAVVAANNEEQATGIHPASSRESFVRDPVMWESTWVKPEQVEVTLIGVADERIKPGTVICASYNAG